jgi:dsRNA-specific ribonuclease
MYAFGRRLNEKFDNGVLRQAFTSRSFVVEQTKKQEELGLSSMDLKDNEYLSSEGQTLLHSTLNTTLKEHFPKFPEPGIE